MGMDGMVMITWGCFIMRVDGWECYRMGVNLNIYRMGMYIEWEWMEWEWLLGNVTEWEWMEWECYRMGMDGMGMIHNVTHWYRMAEKYWIPRRPVLQLWSMFETFWTILKHCSFPWFFVFILSTTKPRTWRSSTCFPWLSTCSRVAVILYCILNRRGYLCWNFKQFDCADWQVSSEKSICFNLNMQHNPKS
jgi:hypothetical protein